MILCWAQKSCPWVAFESKCLNFQSYFGSIWKKWFELEWWLESSAAKKWINYAANYFCLEEKIWLKIWWLFVCWVFSFVEISHLFKSWQKNLALFLQVIKFGPNPFVTSPLTATKIQILCFCKTVSFVGGALEFRGWSRDWNL